jgi:hypothetical protein
VLGGDVSEAALARANETPDRVVSAQRPSGHHLAKPDFLALLGDFQIGPFVDPSAARTSDGIVTCPLDVTLTALM